MYFLECATSERDDVKLVGDDRGVG